VLLIYGAGGHGVSVAEAAVSTGRWREIRFYDDGLNAGTTVGDWRVEGRFDTLGQALSDTARGHEVVVALGRNDLRRQRTDELVSVGATIATVVHARAWVSASARLGAGTVVMAGAVVNARTQIGRGGIVNIGCAVDHDCRIGDFAHLAPGVVLAGGVSVGSLAWLGTGSRVAPGLSVAASVATPPGTTIA
jgi:sugar O-acyltransferase (sialic acid O-acetyltransferase NeuD family)